MEKFHMDILENILKRLTSTEALPASKVCNTWKALLANRCYKEGGYLVSYHLAGNNEVQLYYGEQYDRAHGDVDHRKKMMNYFYGKFRGRDHLVVGSCNGLVCIRKFDRNYEIQYLVCNPLTEEYALVPQFNDLQRRAGQMSDPEWLRLLKRYAPVTDGFGYCQSTNKYKIVRIYYSKIGVGDVMVYTIGGREWRKVGTVHHNFRSSCGVFANGVLHWLNSDVPKHWEDENGVRYSLDSEVRQHKVFGFDLEDETIRMLPMPPQYCEPFGKNPLKLLGGNLCFVRTGFDDCMEIWAFKRNKNPTAEHFQTSSSYYDNNSWSWIKEFSIESKDNHHRFEPFAVTRSDQVLLWHKINTLYGYDPKALTLSKLWDNIIMNNGMSCSCIEVIPHTNSFVSLKDQGESGAKSCKYKTSGYTKQAKRKSIEHTKQAKRKSIEPYESWGYTKQATSIEVMPHTNNLISLKGHGESGDKSCKYKTRGYTRQAKRKRYPIEEPYEIWYSRMIAAGFK